MGTTGKNRRKIVLAAIVVCGVLAGYGAYRWGHRTSADGSNVLSDYTVTRRDLIMSVTESGTIKARNAVEIKSQVEGETTIVNLVPEGTVITEQDIKDGKILVELDSSGLRDNVNQQEITFNSAEAVYTDAKESLTIQKNQNDSDIQQGLMNVKFGKMDLQKYLGEKTADFLIEQYKATQQMPSITDLIKDPNQLGGQSLQDYRKLTADIRLAEEEFKRASTDLSWTEKLFEKSYLSRSELDADRLKVQRLEVAWEQAKTALELFERYQFPKDAQKLFSDYLETERQMERVYAQTRSKLAQAEARLNSSEATYVLNKERLERIRRQLEVCSIRATAPGLVIYASSERGRFGGGSRTYIEVGQQVHERELIMTVTNAAEKDVDVKVHETNVDKVRLGQPVRVIIDAQPDKVFNGRVRKIAPLPDPQAFFGNPDLKVYSTLVGIENVGDQIRPGMSARVEIVIAQLSDVVSIPVQCVANRGGGKVCYVVEGGRPKEQPIQTGAFNDRFVEVMEGLREGQRVLLNPPRLLADAAGPAGSEKKADASEPLTAQAQTDLPMPGANETLSKDNVSPQSQPVEEGIGPDASSQRRRSPRSDRTDRSAAGDAGMSSRFGDMDQNSDGKISLTDEVPERARAFLERLDTNQDGFVDAAEKEAVLAEMGQGAEPGGRSHSPEGTQEPTPW
ncbi:MAG: HlyD family efflux transporter periplasmic adaptor subunit [Planctomycetales bacterium]|nr:HlyD family efflux transporter periplasmic adaptor subunit [Planctomycetales bacterium]